MRPGVVMRDDGLEVGDDWTRNVSEIFNRVQMNVINYLRAVTKTKSIGTRAVLNKSIAIAIVGYSWRNFDPDSM